MSDKTSIKDLANKKFSYVGSEETPKATYEYYQTSPVDENDFGTIIAVVTQRDTGSKHLLLVDNREG